MPVAESQMVPGTLLALQRQSQLSDDDPLYDSVASDDDYATTEQIMESIRSKVSIIGNSYSRGNIQYTLFSTSKT